MEKLVLKKHLKDLGAKPENLGSVPVLAVSEKHNLVSSEARESNDAVNNAGKPENADSRGAPQKPLTASRKGQRNAQQARGKPKEEEPLPESPEIEMALLGAIFQHPETGFAAFGRNGKDQFFHSEINRELYELAGVYWEANECLDMIGFTSHLKDCGRLEEIGGRGVVTSLFSDMIPEGMIDYYIDLLREKYVRRQIVKRIGSLVRSARTEKDLGKILSDLAWNAETLREAAGGVNGAVTFDLDKLLAFDAARDPDCLVGKRFLLRGGSWMIAGPTGCGKSSLLIQLGVYWATGTPMFGVKPVRPLKILIFQAEDDFGDVSEQLQGVYKGIQASEDISLDDLNEKVHKNLTIKQARGISGQHFLEMTEEYARILKPDIVAINPLFSYAGCDLLDAAAIGNFLRDRLFALGDKFHYCTVVIHHVSKPPREGGDPDSTMYLGFGSSEVQNSFRAVSTIMRVRGTDTWKFDFGKRIYRCGARKPSGELTDVVYIEHGKDGICWHQVEEPEMGNAEDILAEMTFDDPMKTGAIQAKLYADRDMPRRTFYRIWKALRKEGKIKEIKVGKKKGWIVVSATSAKDASDNL